MEALVNSITDPITTLTATLNIGDANASVVAPTAPDAWPINQEFRLRIDNELIIFSAATSNATSLVVVTRGVEGTANVSHASTQNVYGVYTKASLERWVQKYGLPGDIAPATANALDDEFSGSAIDAKWSWRNQGASTYIADFDREVAKLSVPSGATTNFRIIEQNVPGSDFTVVTKLFPALPVTVDLFIAGLAVINSTNGRLITLGYRCGTSATAIRVHRWNSVTGALSATAITSPSLTISAPIFFKIVTTGSKATLNFYFSGDGYSWVPLGSETVSTFLTATGGTMDKLGVCLDAETTTFTPIEMTLYHFRVS